MIAFIRAAYLVDGGAAGSIGNAGGTRRLARRCLAQSGRQHAAHDHFIDLVRRQAGVFQRTSDGRRAKGRRGHAGELAKHGTDGGALGTDDDDVGHETTPVGDAAGPQAGDYPAKPHWGGVIRRKSSPGASRMHAVLQKRR
jgi:hypothetical protein